MFSTARIRSLNSVPIITQSDVRMYVFEQMYLYALFALLLLSWSAFSSHSLHMTRFFIVIWRMLRLCQVSKSDIRHSLMQDFDCSLTVNMKFSKLFFCYDLSNCDGS